jgi:hypothetical protein
MGGGDVAEVERRVLPHQHDVDVAAEVEDRELAEAEMIAGTACTLTSCAPA